ncbi:DUF2922 domain-containing protein [Furfurilactobacillus entadae]|uniref:DUF2922 domain-containing protein n=1 Tax=Furfurilactobacillus entadae TaxID=2922307 RepID=UPI0035E47199
MKELNLKFKTATGKTARLKLRTVNESLTPEVVKTAMANMIAAGIIVDKNGQLLYAKAVGAHYSETVTTPIFDEEPAPATTAH